MHVHLFYKRLIAKYNCRSFHTENIGKSEVFYGHIHFICFPCYSSLNEDLAFSPDLASFSHCDDSDPSRLGGRERDWAGNQTHVSQGEIHAHAQGQDKDYAALQS